MTFSIDEMISALERIGYTIKRETEARHISYYPGQDEYVDTPVINVYYKGERINVFDFRYGEGRVSSVFEQEFKKRLLLTLFGF